MQPRPSFLELETAHWFVFTFRQTSPTISSFLFRLHAIRNACLVILSCNCLIYRLPTSLGFFLLHNSELPESRSFPSSSRTVSKHALFSCNSKVRFVVPQKHIIRREEGGRPFRHHLAVRDLFPARRSSIIFAMSLRLLVVPLLFIFTNFLFQLATAQAYDFGVDVSTLTRRDDAKKPIVVRRLPVPLNGSLPIRVEIRQLAKNKYKWDLFILAMSMFEFADQGDPLSWYQIAGISFRSHVSLSCLLI